MNAPSVLHASLIALRHRGAWRGLLLTGPSAAGKSDLALRACADGWRLVADDRVTAWACDGSVFGRAPSALEGLLECRGQGMARLPLLPFTRIAAVVRLGEPSERQPEPQFETVAEISLPAHDLAPLEASAVARLRRIVDGLDP